MTGLLVPGPLHEKAIFTPTHCHPIGVMTVTLLIHHFIVKSIIWNSFRFLSLPAAGAPLGQTNAFALKLTTRKPWFLLTKIIIIAMAWLRELFWLSVRHNFHLRTRHLTGINNINADRLSRLFQSWTLSNEIFSPL